MSVTIIVVISILSTLSIPSILFGIVKLGVAIYPLWRDYRNKQYLDQKLSRGPYDKATIERSTRYYIRPKCTNIDPGQELELRHALIATREDLFDKIDQFLDHDNSHRHLLILADSGTGKTSFLLNYYVHNDHRPKRKRHKLAIVPLGQKNADELITRVSDQQDTAILLDALDEDIKAHTDHAGRIKELMDKCAKFRRVIMTCRTQFFPKDEEIPVTTGIVRLGPLRAGEKSNYEFWKLYLAPFDDNDVGQYVKKRYPFWHYHQRSKARAIIKTIPLLSVRPMLLAHIPDLIERGTKIDSCYQLYNVMVDAWLEREIAWADKEALRRISEFLAVDMYINRESRGMERIPREQLSSLAEKWDIRLHSWQISSRSLLNRDAEGNCKFAHRSIMEFLFSQQLMRGVKECFDVLLTDQMKRFLIEMLWETKSPTLTVNIDVIMRLLAGLELRAHRYEESDEKLAPMWLRQRYGDKLASIFVENPSVFATEIFARDNIIFTSDNIPNIDHRRKIYAYWDAVEESEAEPEQEPEDEIGRMELLREAEIGRAEIRRMVLLREHESMHSVLREEELRRRVSREILMVPMRSKVKILTNLTDEQLRSLDTSGNLANFVSFIKQYGIEVWLRISRFNSWFGQKCRAQIEPAPGDSGQLLLKFTPHFLRPHK